MRKPGRPLGPVAIAVLDLLRRRRLTAREIARELQLSKDAAKVCCCRLLGYGLIDVFERRRVPESNKPAHVYAAVHGRAHPPALMTANSRVGNA